jgi:heme exporter protein CcmD
MIDLGPYGFYVLSAYGVTLTLIAALVLQSIRRSEKVRITLEALEARRGRTPRG